MKIVVTDRRITPEISETLRGSFAGLDSIVMELSSKFQEFDAVSSLTGEYSREKALEDYFAELYRERKGEAQPDKKDLALLRFAAEQTLARDFSEKREETLEKDAGKLLAYILEQEARGE